MTRLSNSHVQCGTRLREIEDLLRFLDHLAYLPVDAATPDELAEHERQVCQATDRLAGLIVGEMVQTSLTSEVVGKQVETLVKDNGGVRGAYPESMPDWWSWGFSSVARRRSVLTSVCSRRP